MAQRVQYLPAMQETQVQSLGWEDPLGKEMATYSSILIWKIPRMEEIDSLQSYTWRIPWTRDWQATPHGVVKSQTQLSNSHTQTQDHGIQSHHFMAKWKVKCGSSDKFSFLGLQNHCSDCSHEIRRHLLLERKAMTSLDSMLESRDITVPTKLWFFQQSCTVVRAGP